MSEEGTTQGDPLAMCTYAIATMPLIHRLDKHRITQAWFADDATATGQLQQTKNWWDSFCEIGPDYGYNVNACKSWLIVKEDLLDEASALFKGSNVQITSKGSRHLGAAIGSTSFIRSYVTEKVNNWVDEVHLLSKIANSQPHAPYCALTDSLMSKWAYLQRTIPGISHLFLPLENAIRHQLLPSITGKDAFSDKEQDLLALPTRLGGLGITNLTKSADDCYTNSKKITAPPIQLILQQAKDSQKKRNNCHVLGKWLLVGYQNFVTKFTIFTLYDNFDHKISF